MPGWLASAAPASSPNPETTFSAPSGKPDLERELGDADEREPGVLGGLDDAGVAAGKRRADRAAEDLARIVPRHDVARDAVRIAHHRDRIAVEERDGLAVDLVGGRAVELEIARRRDDVGAALRDRLAGVLGLERAELVDARRDRLAEPQQQPAALRRREPAPGAVERGARRLHGGIDVGGAGARDRRERLAVGRAEHVDGAIVRGRHAPAADEVEVERLRAGRPFVARVHGGSSWRVGFLYTGRPARAARDQARSRARSHAVAGRSNRR